MPALIILTGVLFRTVYLFEVSQDPGFSHPIYDPEYNAYWARSLATGDWTVPEGMTDPEIRTTPHGRPPGYPWFLAAVYAVFGVNDYAPRIIQMLVGVANALLLYAMGKRLFGNATGFLAGLFMALYWVFPYFEGILTYPSIAIFLLLTMLTLLVHWYENPMLRWVIPAGMFLGAFALFRPNGLLIAPCVLTWMGWVLRNRSVSLWRIGTMLVTFTIGCAGVLAPAFIRNYIVARDVVFISSYGGINFYVGNHPEASLVEPRIPELMDLAGIEHWSCFDYPAIVRGLAVAQGRDSIKYSDANRYFYRKAFSFIASDPLSFLRNLGLKTLLLFGPREITNDTVMEYDKRFSRILGPIPGFPWVLAFSLLGIVIFAKGTKVNYHPDARACGWLFLSIVFFYSLSVIIYFIAGRYRVPIIPILLLFAAYGVIHVAVLIREHRLLNAGAYLLLLISLIFAAHWNITGYVPSEATWHLRRALAFTAQGNDAEARSEYLRAETLGADSSIIYANLGRLHFKNGEIQSGLDMYNKGLEKNPHNTIIRNNLGYELFKLNHLDAAIQHLKQAVAFNPRFVLARINLGNALAEKGDFNAALAQFEEAMRLNPKEPSAPYNAARVSFAKGDYIKAVELYHVTLALSPAYALALNNLGYSYEVQGEYEKALPYYQRAIAAEPAFLLAYNNLGNVLLTLGRSEQAENILLQALEREPENLYALYNLGRVYVAMQAWEKALVYTRKALQVNSEYVPALIQLAIAHSGRGEAAPAIEALEKALTISPEDAEAAKRLADLKEAKIQETKDP